MSDPRFLQDGFDAQLAHVIEECGEVLAAAGKTQRWGRQSTNPLIPIEQRETNEVWLAREVLDLREAVDRLLKTMGVPPAGAAAELEQLRAAAQHVLMCRASGDGGPDGRMGLRLLEKAVASKTAAAEAERWTHPELTPVKYERDDGTIVLTKTRTKAMVLGGHTAVIWLQGVPGCVLLSRVTLDGGGA